MFDLNINCHSKQTRNKWSIVGSQSIGVGVSFVTIISDWLFLSQLIDAFVGPDLRGEVIKTCIQIECKLIVVLHAIFCEFNCAQNHQKMPSIHCEWMNIFPHIFIKSTCSKFRKVLVYLKGLKWATAMALQKEKTLHFHDVWSDHGAGTFTKIIALWWWLRNIIIIVKMLFNLHSTNCCFSLPFLSFVLLITPTLFLVIRMTLLHMLMINF